MARILYSVQGIGMGHSMRSLVVIEHLRAQGHEILITANHKAYPFFKSRYEQVYELKGFRFVLNKEGAMLWVPTFLEWIEKMPIYFVQNARRLRKIINEFKPEIIITDFEPFAHYLAQIYRLPSISIDNQHRIIYCPLKVPREYREDLFRAKVAIRTFVTRADYYIILDFADNHTKKPRDNTWLVPPILRESILRAKPTDGGFILVYMWERYAQRAIPVLKQMAPQKFVLYGLNKSGEDGNITFRPFSDEQMVKDLAACRAIIGNAGFTLVGEAMFLNKPFLVIPMAGQFEQVVNALEIADKGYGLTAEELTPEIIADFLNDLPKFKKALRGNNFCGNKKLFKILDKIIKKETE